jgi:hypothetical protein
LPALADPLPSLHGGAPHCDRLVPQSHGIDIDIVVDIVDIIVVGGGGGGVVVVVVVVCECQRCGRRRGGC